MKVYAEDNIKCPKCQSLIDLDESWTVDEEFTGEEVIYRNCGKCKCGAYVHWNLHYKYSYYDEVSECE